MKRILLDTNGYAAFKTSDLDHLAGTWSEKDFTEFQKRIADFEAIDEKMWK